MEVNRERKNDPTPSLGLDDLDVTFVHPNTYSGFYTNMFKQKDINYFNVCDFVFHKKSHKNNY